MIRGQVRSSQLPADIGAGVMALVVCLTSACATRQPQSLAERFVRGTPNDRSGVTLDVAPAPRDGEAQKSAELTATPPPATKPAPKSSDLPTVEHFDAALAEALSALAAHRSPDTHRRVAEEYRRLQVFDRAHDHLTRAIALDPKDAAAYDGLARLWRDWGLPAKGLSLAYMAIHLAPSSAPAHNTAGTLLHVLGNPSGAKEQFEIALKLDPDAAYALNNLCYVAFVEGDAERALELCGEAIRRSPELTPTRNNLALVHAASGRLDAAEREFLAGGDKAAAHYNMGIVHLARRDFAAAAGAFEAAVRARPSFREAELRADQARALASLAASSRK